MRKEMPVLATKLSKVYGCKVCILGPYLCRDGRKRVDVRLYGKEGSPLLSHPLSKTVQLARVRLEIKLGRPLRKGETVDHRDNDFTNDSYDNVQLLSLEANAAKQTKLTRQSSAEAAKRPENRLKNSLARRGHLNPRAKLSKEKASQLREAYSNGRITISEIQKVAGFKTKKSVLSLLRGASYFNARGPKLNSLPDSSPGRPSSLSLKQKGEIIKLLKSGINNKAISSKLNVSYDAVRRFVRKFSSGG